MTLGAFVSKGGCGDGLQTEARSPSFPRLDLFQQQTPTDGSEVAAVRAWVFLGFFFLLFHPGLMGS